MEPIPWTSIASVVLSLTAIVLSVRVYRATLRMEAEQAALWRQRYEEIRLNPSKRNEAEALSRALDRIEKERIGQWQHMGLLLAREAYGYERYPY